MTISLGLLLLVIVALAWKMKGAQMPHVILGALAMKAATPGSIVDIAGQSGVDLLQTTVTQVAELVGQSGLV